MKNIQLNLSVIKDKADILFQAFMLSIALTVIKTGPNMGLLLFALAFTITITRLLTGEHYLTDIIASILIALGIYFIS